MVSKVHIESRWRLGFVWSALLHCGVVGAILLGPSTLGPGPHPRNVNRRYSVLVLRLQDFHPAPRIAARSESAGGNGASTVDGNPSPPASEGSASQATTARTFVLPPIPRRDPVKQTLVQFDVPPDIQLKHEIPLPAALLWDQLPPVRRTFVAPAAREKLHPVVETPAAPELSPPNRETVTADLKIAAVIMNQNAKLVRPAAKTAPVVSAGAQPAAEPPQIAPLEATDSGLTALISQPDAPVMGARIAAVPPANQVAASGSGGDGNPNGRPGDGNGLPGSKGTTGGDRGSTVRAGGGSGVNGASERTGSGTGVMPGGNAGFARSGVGSGGGIGDSNPQPDLPISGTTRFTFPKNGKFSVIVTGSSVAAPYAESAGMLSGKMVYSVYISVGLRKKWILEYCLPRTEEQKITVKGRAQSIEAPWPYVIDRPDNIGAPGGEYVMVHGVLTPEGRFDQLALIVPGDLEKKDLLMSSLKHWTFRPAARDGVPSAVEIMLIIPSQSE